MELRYIFMIIAMVCRVQSTIHRNSRGETDEQRCEATCEGCYNNHDSLQRMGCLEKCIREGVDQFRCPEKQSFLSAITTPSSALRKEIEDFAELRMGMFSAKDVAGIATTFTENSLVVIDNQKPTIGRAERAKQLSDFFTANPDEDHIFIDFVACGEEHGIIWANGIQTNYDKQDRVLSSFRFMTLLKRGGAGQLQEFTLALFQ
ncbi:uncharacterized protein [Amphiura filiformis]|uniref:uncharacterized protein n=1 Tax=Amphiura filiformis TaxID=82378 RepID=UPI003B210456